MSRGADRKRRRHCALLLSAAAVPFMHVTAFHCVTAIQSPKYKCSHPNPCVLLLSATPTTKSGITNSSSNSQRKSGKKNKYSKKSRQKSSSLVQAIQTEGHTPILLLSNVGSKISPEVDADGRVSSLVLVRLAKLAIEIDNQSSLELWKASDSDYFMGILERVCSTLAEAIVTNRVDMDSGVEGIKAAGVIARILPESSTRDTFSSLMKAYDGAPVDVMDEHHLSGLRWAYDNLSLSYNKNDSSDLLPRHINEAYQKLNVPFRIRSGLLSGVKDLTVAQLKSQVDFRAETVQTTGTAKAVKERRLTAWEAESEDARGFAYSGKVMETKIFSPLVRAVRDELLEKTGERYDCCLLNLYPSGESGMRYHIDPDQGKLWGFETAVVSVGATRKFAFRTILELVDRNQSNGFVHNFIVMEGDVTEMFGNCQTTYQHTVRTADDKNETAARSSLVFKKTLK